MSPGDALGAILDDRFNVILAGPSPGCALSTQRPWNKQGAHTARPRPHGERAVAAPSMCRLGRRPGYVRACGLRMDVRPRPAP